MVLPCCFFCLISSWTPKDSSFTIISDKYQQCIIRFKMLEPANVLHILLGKWLNPLSLIKKVWLIASALICVNDLFLNCCLSQECRRLKTLWSNKKESWGADNEREIPKSTHKNCFYSHISWEFQRCLFSMCNSLSVELFKFKLVLPTRPPSGYRQAEASSDR